MSCTHKSVLIRIFGISPGCRIPIGEEPILPLHIKQTSRFHKYFKSGIGDIFPFDETACKNPSSILDIIKGAFEEGMRYFSLYGSVRMSFALPVIVKKSEMNKLFNKEQVIQQTVVFGLGARKLPYFGRRVRGNE